nr:PREDICTED: uncharacterized protein LOC107791160 [Nicotiana tabacum]
MTSKARMKAYLYLPALEEVKLREVQDMKRVGDTPTLMDRIGFWNPRGLNKPDKQREINLFIHNLRVGLFGFLETNIKRAKAQKASLNLCQGCEVKHQGNGLSFNVTLVYGFNKQAARRKLWEDINQIGTQMDGPWAVMGDFNCVLNKEERIGSKVIMAETREFRQCIEVCGLKEFRSSGAFFTWNNKQGGDSRVYSKIDRVLVNTEWMTDLHVSEVHFMSEGIYDHCPAIINWEGGSTGHKRQFRYFNMWSLIPEFKPRVQEVWKKELKATKMYKLVGKLNRTKSVLQRLNKERFSDVEGKAETAMASLIECQEKIQKDPRNAELIIEEIKLMQESIKWKAAKEQFLRQKCKIQWLRQGDQNKNTFIM